MPHLQLKNDEFRASRGGYARLLVLSCAACGDEFARYQKDGPGPLKRLYFDRLLAPTGLVGFESKPLKKVLDLACLACGEKLGVPYLYEKEQRGAFRLFQNAVNKKLIKL